MLYLIRFMFIAKSITISYKFFFTSIFNLIITYTKISVQFHKFHHEKFYIVI